VAEKPATESKKPGLKAPGAAKLRLKGEDEEDLAVISAVLQDAFVSVADMVFQPEERRFVLVANRFRHEDDAKAPPESRERVMTGLRIDGVTGVKRQGFHPGETERLPFVTEQLAESQGPIVAVTDFMRSVPDQVSRWMPRRFTSLGTDGFGRSDTRDVLRRFFEVDAAHVVVAVLHGLAADGGVPPGTVSDAIERYGIDPATGDPWSS